MIRRLFRNESVVVILLAVVVLAGWLGSRGLGEPDEGRFAEVAREMALQSDWLIPHLNGVPHFQKPPLTYWITAVFIRLFGANEWAVRLTCALAALGTLLFTMYIAGVLYGKGCRWKAGLLLVVSMGFFIIARLITADMLLTLCITASTAGLVGYVHRGQKAWLCVFYIAMGLGFLAKGPLAIIIPSLAAVAVQLEQKRHHKPVVRLFWWLGLPIALLIGLSWYLALIHRERTLFDYFVRYEFIDRIATNAHNRAKPIWFYPGTLVLGFVPWTAFMIVMLRDLWCRRKNLCSANLWLFVGWIVVPYIILSLVVSKLATYLLPFLPPLAIVVARWFDHPGTGDGWRRPACFTAGVLALMLPALPALALLPRVHQPPLLTLPVGFLVAMIAATASFLFLVRAVNRGLALKSFMFWMAATWACVMLALASQADTLMTGGNRPVRSLTESVTRMDPEGTVPVFIIGRAHGTEFYLRRFVYRGVLSSDVVLPLDGEPQQRIVQDELQTFRSFAERPAFIIVKQERYLMAPEQHKWRTIVQDGDWMLLASRHVEPIPPQSKEVVGDGKLERQK